MYGRKRPFTYLAVIYYLKIKDEVWLKINQDTKIKFINTTSDMVESSAPKTPSNEKKFITFLINYVVRTNPGDLQTNLMHMSKHMTDDLAPKCEENLYRKQYGNLKECVLAGKTIMKVFVLDGTCFKFRKPVIVEQVYNAGNLEESAWEKYKEGRISYLTKHLTLAKNNAMNICVNCEMKYYVKAKGLNCS